MLEAMDVNPKHKQEHQAAAPFLGVPESALVNILKWLPQHDRLAYAALVCKSWAAAAVAATSVVSLARWNPAVATGLSSWVQQQGREVLKVIRVPKHQQSVSYLVQLQLPSAGLAKLELLHLNNCALVVCSSSGSSAQSRSAAIVLPALRFLALHSSTVSPDTLAHLVCPKLTAVNLLYPLERYYTPARDDQLFDTALSAFLQRHPWLLQLNLRHEGASNAALAQLSCLQKLQQCSMWCPRTTPVVLGHLSTSLTYLTLNGRLQQSKEVLQEGDLPAGGWPHLKQLTMSYRALQPALLTRWTKLERLSLTDCKLVTEWDEDYTDYNSEAGGVELMSALAQLTRLKQLDLTNILLDSIGSDANTASETRVAAAAARSSAFSALTASTQLESLKLIYNSEIIDEIDGHLIQPLPQGAFAQLFPPGRQLTALTELTLDGLDHHLMGQLQDDEQYYDPYEDDRDPYDKVDCVRDADLGLLLAACPKLRRLTLNTVLTCRCKELEPFLEKVQGQLQLSYLCLGGPCLGDYEARAVAGITSLRELELHNAPDLTTDGIEHLTKLQQLTRLELSGVARRRCIRCQFTSTPSKSQGDPPDVWQQLVRALSMPYTMMYDYDDYSDSD